MDYKIGITVHNFESEISRMQVEALLQMNIIPDFIIYHQAYYKRMLLRLITRLLYKDNTERKAFNNKIKAIKKFNIKNINSQASSVILTRYEPAIVVANSGYIFKSTILGHPEIFFMNSHASKLPEYRGVSNIEWALWDQKDIHITIHRINNGIDEGDILYQEKVMSCSENKLSLAEIKAKVQKSIPLVMAKAIEKFYRGECRFIKQKNNGKLQMQHYSMHYILKQVLETRIYCRSIKVNTDTPDE